MRTLFSWKLGSIVIRVAIYAIIATPAFAAKNALREPVLATDLLTDIPWLVTHLGDSRLVIIDARPEASYLKGHIQGAVNLPVNATFGTEQRPDLVAPMTQIQALISQAGIDNKTPVAIYDNGGYIDAARLFWVFEMHGHSHVTILNGGFPQWQKDNLPQSRTPTKRARKRFIPAIHPRRLAAKFSTRLAIDDRQRVIIDARSKAEYQGIRSKANRYGHIPNAISIPWSTNFSEVDGISKIKPIAELKTLYADIDPQQQIITYCNKGKQAALTYFTLRLLGRDVASYDGSWVEWGNDSTLPIEGP